LVALAFGVVGALLGLAAPAHVSIAQTTAPSSWTQGWAVGHDPQQTGRSLSTVRLHPRLIVTYTDDSCAAPLVDGAGGIYAWCGKGLTALTMTGRRRWRVALSPVEGGPPALAPDGLVLANANDGMTGYRHQFIIALAMAWSAPSRRTALYYGPSPPAAQPAWALRPRSALVPRGPW